MRYFFLVAALVATSCAGSIDQVGDMTSSAPDWYAQRKQEVAGNDYPRIADVPVVTEANLPESSLKLSRAENIEAYRAFQRDPRSEGAVETPQQIKRWAKVQVAAVNERDTDASFLTDADVKSLKARFPAR